MPGCRNIPDAGVETPNEGEEAPDEGGGNLKEVVLQSYSLEDLGVTIDIQKLDSFEDPNTNYPGGYEIFAGSQFPLSCSQIPNTSIIAINYCVHYNVGIDYMAALYLQGVYRPTGNESNNFIIVGDERYSLIDLADCTIYADDRIIVFDVTDYLPIDSFDIRIETESLQWEDYSHQWMIEVYNYLKTYQDIIIIYND